MYPHPLPELATQVVHVEYEVHCPATPPTPHSRTTPATHGGHPPRPMATGDAAVPLIEEPASNYLYASLGYSAAGTLKAPGAAASTGGRTLTASSGTGSTGGTGIGTGTGTGNGGPAVIWL
mgnify:FL=1